MQISDHLIIAPIILPLMCGALLLLLDERRRVLKSVISVLSTFALLCIALLLLQMANAEPSTGTAGTRVYLLGNWVAPFGIVLVLDRLSAMMITLAAVLASAAIIFSLARWYKTSPHFHTLFQFLLMGINGAFLTGDLFNLFVFFEVLLAASYGLVLYGSGATRVRAGLHYIVVNLVGASLFLIGVSLIYGVTGTLNMADLAVKIATLPDENLVLLKAGAAALGLAFAIKAGMWPLSFWLPAAYWAAAAPIAAIFVILSKVGIYILLRLSLMLFGAGGAATAGFGQSFLLFGGMATIFFGAIGVLGSQAMGRLAGFSVLVSSGTLLAAIGLSDKDVTSGALFYMVSSTLAIAAFFLLIELLERAQDPAADVLAVTREAFADEDEEEEEEELGVVIPGTLALLGISFACSGLLLSGMPPLSGFIGKFSMLSAMINVPAIKTSTWVLFALIIVSGLFTLIALVRVGIRTFWDPIEGTVPRVRLIEIVPVVSLIGLCVFLTVQGGPVLRYLDATAQSLHSPDSYIQNVLAQPYVPGVRGGAE